MTCSCGCSHFVRRIPVAGVWIELVRFHDGTGVRVELSETEGLRNTKQPVTMRCDGCGKVHRNPDWGKDRAPNVKPAAAEKPKCVDCGTTENVSLGPCPYESEINGNDTEYEMCSGCRSDRAMDI